MRIVTILLLAAASAMAGLPHEAGAADVAKGKQIYAQKCSSCHGKEGKGDGVIGKKLVPPPSDFTDPAGTPAKGEAELMDKIARGGKGTAMPAFKSLSDQDRADVLAYIKTLAARGN